MRFNRVKLPHPVLVNFNDDVTGSANFIKYNVYDTLDSFSIEVECTFSGNETLQKLLENGGIHYACQIDCPSTLFLHGVFNSDGIFNIKVLKTDVKYLVFCNFYLVCAKDIEYFTNDVHPDYGNAPLKLEKGSILALFPEEIKFDSDIVGEDLQNPDNIFQVVRLSDANNQEYASHLLEDKKITLLLPERIFDIYKQYHIMSNEKYKAIIYSCFLLPLLKLAIDEYIENPELDEDDENKDNTQIWKRIISEKLANETVLYELDESDMNYSLICAQIILKDPLYEMNKNLNEFANSI